MKAIRFNVSIPRYAFGKVAGPIYAPLLWSGLSCLYVDDIEEPKLLGPDWVKVKTSLGGICGTDTSTIYLDTSTYFEPFSSSPFTMGHENVGVISEVGEGASEWKVGDRVIVEPTLWCAPRGFAEEDWCEFCKTGEVNRCTNATEGDLVPGLSLGACADTGGCWSGYYLAHKSQLYKVPDTVSDENAMLVEPFCCGLHAALQSPPSDDETVLILGAGTIGLMQLAALRAMGSKATIIIAARYSFQAEAAEKLGASEVLMGGDVYKQIAERTGGKLYSPILGKRVLVGGVDRTYECVGKDSALDDAFRLTKAGGDVIIVGMSGLAKGIDWSAIFLKELTVYASYIYNHADEWEGKTVRTYDLALDWMASGDLDIGWMVNKRYALDEYGKALREIGDKKKNPIIKAVFDFKG